MKKQKSRLSLSFLLLFAGCLVSAIPFKAYANPKGYYPRPAYGTSVESSTFSGDTFIINNTNQLPLNVPPALEGRVFVQANGTISIPLEIQQNLNSVANYIVQQAINSDSTSVPLGTTDAPFSTSTSIIVAIFLQGTNASAAINQLQTSLLNLGVPQSLINELLKNLAGLFQGSDSAAMSPVPITAAQRSQLLATTKLAQSRAKSQVNINQLNAAIEAYNNIVLKSNAQTLKNLSKNPEFVEIGRILKQLRAALTS